MSEFVTIVRSIPAGIWAFVVIMGILGALMGRIFEQAIKHAIVKEVLSDLRKK